MKKENIFIELVSAEEFSSLLAEKVKDKIKGYFPDKEEADFLTRQQTAKLLKISLPTLHKWTKQGRLKSYKISGRVRYKRSEVSQSLTQIPY